MEDHSKDGTRKKHKNDGQIESRRLTKKKSNEKLKSRNEVHWMQLNTETKQQKTLHRTNICQQQR